MIRNRGQDSRAEYWNTRVAQGTALLEDALIAMDGLTEEEAKIKGRGYRSGEQALT
jgi:hypothetical protein